MNKKKLSGQTITIIVLIILLLAAIAFGGVYAFYSTATNKISGTISLATLNIDFSTQAGDGTSGSSAILISTKDNIVPNEKLGNSPLEILNTSNSYIYLVVVYQVLATKNETAGEEKGRVVVDDYSNPVLDVAAQYNNENLTSDFAYYLYTSSKNGKKYHCLITKQATIADKITVIKENGLRLHRDVGNGYMSCDLTFKFQGFAIGEGKGGESYGSISNLSDRCRTIMDNIYQSYEYSFEFFDVAIQN